MTWIISPFFGISLLPGSGLKKQTKQADSDRKMPEIAGYFE
ncbi:hypothetical protein XBJ2_730011 [Xenorhabdus bovienii str. Jollieti]|uniref:Uncharacterized protein n=2 Tax=Xenorhabdus bovienii TaxID=40576 RepID=A0A077QC66_XENBV|nr:hypothetical protein XBJ1_1492 [Xenorhabdus bovienii SS-2004]CDH30329.1 hypothetical protein XBJ2_730011 [Xenorhabdus bovienii str. Jollieti]CDH30740.1 hypothetical protein XBI1_1050001 [Xenorhabdus bovienii str. Intermedium]